MCGAFLALISSQRQAGEGASSLGHWTRRESSRLLQARAGCGSAQRLVGEGEEIWVWDVSGELGKQQLYSRKRRVWCVPLKPPVFCMSEASLNGQRLTLWGPLLGQRWEEQSGRGWGFSKSWKVRKSKGKLAAWFLPTLGVRGVGVWSWVEGAGAGLLLPLLCNWCSEEPCGACVVELGLMSCGPFPWACQAPVLVL